MATHQGRTEGGKMLDCPFCGGHAIFKTDGGSWGYMPPTKWIQCSNDKCLVMPRVPAKATEDWTPKRGHFTVNVDAALLKAWNTRATKEQG